MIISSTENTSLHNIMFDNSENYDKWAPYFYEEFIKPNSISSSRLTGVMTPAMVSIDDSFASAFIQWLKEKGVAGI